MGTIDRGVAVVTGASSGIGAATARALAEAGFRIVLGARRLDRLAEVAASIGDGASFAALDVTDPESVVRFCDGVEECRLLVNNAGGAIGLERLEETKEADWTWMYEANVLGVMRMTKALLPKLIASGDGQIVTLGSVAAFDPYVGGAGYCAAKAGVRAVMDVLRLELLGQPVRLTEVDPGMVETEFSLVRFRGDEGRATDLYAGMTPLTGEDVADCIAFAATRPSHVDIDQMIIRPRDQARVGVVHRRKEG
ncbi:MAG TPA: SDR family NAD(P)-dependent oxidoreductase [Acidimicrobiales bacterium]|nr:SDR family NAD(P)-dependent oxidoreductase [Acidimicrobiales bacterium]